MNKKKNQTESTLVYSTNKDWAPSSNEIEEEDTLAPNLQKLKIKLDTKQRAGKVVTLIEGFKGKTIDAETLGKMLKTKCGTGCSVKENIILIQGDYKNKVIDRLTKLQYKVS